MQKSVNLAGIRIRTTGPRAKLARLTIVATKVKSPEAPGAGGNQDADASDSRGDLRPRAELPTPSTPAAFYTPSVALPTHAISCMGTLDPYGHTTAQAIAFPDDADHTCSIVTSGITGRGVDSPSCTRVFPLPCIPWGMPGIPTNWWGARPPYENELFHGKAVYQM
jgi:hypothetical protein